MATVPIYVLAGQSNAKRVEVYESVRSSLADLGGPSKVIHAGSTAAGLTSIDGVPDWNPSSGSDLFSQMLTQIWTAVAEVVAAGDTPVAGGFFWVQGEEDASNAASAAAYQANLESFISTVRDNFGIEFPFVIAELRTTADPWPHHEAVRDAQHAVANGNDVLLLETDGFELSDDNVHYSIAGRHDLGAALVKTIEARHLDLVGSVDASPQVLKGKAGADELVGGIGNDKIHGHAGQDTLFGGGGDDYLFGGTAGDRLYGGAGNDRLYGEQGNDFLVGGAGDDRIFGGARDDVMIGGEGRDRFFFVDTDGADSHDTILDFEVGKDFLIMRGLAVSEVESTSGGALVHFDSGATVLLADIDAAALTPKSFVFQDLVA